MSNSLIHFLDLFEALPEGEKQTAASEILRRVRFGDDDLPTAVFDGLTDELFAGLDAEEAAHAER